MKHRIHIAILLCVFACNREDVEPEDNTVHLAGVVATSTGVSGDASVASYWKDGFHTDLTNNETASGVNSLYVDGASVLIGGWKFISNAPTAGLFWKDGNENIIEDAFGSSALVASSNDNLFGVWLGSSGWVLNKNGVSQAITDTAEHISATGISVRGDDLYICGSSEYRDWSSVDAPMYVHAQYWKNGQLVFRESEQSYVHNIFVHGDDVYMAGLVYDDETLKSIACYWKNGQRVELTDGNLLAEAKSVFATDAHVYVSGMLDNQAVYWKDGVATNLTTSGVSSVANAIFVKGTDVHVGGQANGHPGYWKNDARVTIANQERVGKVEYLVVGSN